MHILPTQLLETILIKVILYQVLLLRALFKVRRGSSSLLWLQLVSAGFSSPTVGPSPAPPLSHGQVPGVKPLQLRKSGWDKSEEGPGQSQGQSDRRSSLEIPSLPEGAGGELLRKLRLAWSP